MRMPHILFPVQNAIAAFVAVGIFAPLLWMALDRMEPYAITGGQIDPPSPVKGTEFTVTWEIKALRSCQPQYSSVTRVIIDSQGFRHTAAPTQATFGTPEESSDDKIMRLVKLPENISGPAKYFSNVCYACNPVQVLWPVCMRTPTLDFMIAERAEIE